MATRQTNHANPLPPNIGQPVNLTTEEATTLSQEIKTALTNAGMPNVNVIFASSPSPDKHPFHKTRPCQFYRRGHCHKGEGCTYIHDEEQQQDQQDMQVPAEHHDTRFRAENHEEYMRKWEEYVQQHEEAVREFEEFRGLHEGYLVEYERYQQQKQGNDGYHSVASVPVAVATSQSAGGGGEIKKLGVVEDALEEEAAAKGEEALERWTEKGQPLDSTAPAFTPAAAGEHVQWKNQDLEDNEAHHSLEQDKVQKGDACDDNREPEPPNPSAPEEPAPSTSSQRETNQTVLLAAMTEIKAQDAFE
ncbi:hypothetical protein PRZ48_009408 [Zasmidium cellare]|uniref:C3H1-type domain-containing protein n=1 Tax=Zasmidium cellare TaxID=395010 RepID=A0ABR0ECP1_ZASCE|nr:hypothetical protein PRZ48_009408 [Zasmidium cellare]